MADWVEAKEEKGVAEERVEAMVAAGSQVPQDYQRCR